MANEFRIKNGFLSTGNSEITGSLIVTSGVTASLQGTASFAISSSYAQTASYVETAQTASYVLNAISSSYSTFALSALSASYAPGTPTISSSYALTASYVNPLTQDVDITGQTDITGNVLVTGSLTVSGSNSIVNLQELQFDTEHIATGHTTGRMYWDDSNKTATLDMQGSDVRLQLGQEMHVRATNTSGVTIPNGSAVRISGVTGTNLNIELAVSKIISFKASTEINEILGLATEEILNNQSGYITTFGLVGDLDTSAFSEGDILYLSNTTSGSYSNTKPPAPYFQARVGVVKVSNNGAGVIISRPKEPTFLTDISQISSSGVIPNEKAYLVYDDSTDLINFTNEFSGQTIIVTGTINGKDLVLGPTARISNSSGGALLFQSNINASGLNITGSNILATDIKTTSASGSFSGSFIGDGSQVTNVVSSSYALTASYVETAQTSSYVLNAVSSSYATSALSASYAPSSPSISSSYATTASFAQSGDGIFSGSFSGSFQGDGSGLTGVTAASANLYTTDGTVGTNRIATIGSSLTWTGGQEIRIVNSRIIREVTQDSDLPTALVANTTYIIRGSISTSTNRTCNVEGVEILGQNRDLDEIVWTGTGAFLTLTDCSFSLQGTKFSSTTSGNSILSATNVAASGYNNGRLNVLTILNCQFRGTYDIMDINGYDLVDINNTLFFYIKATNFGLRFRDTSKLEISSCELIRWFDESTIPTPSGYATVSMIELQNNNLASFGAVNINGCIVHPQQRQNGIDIGTSSTTGFGTISSNAFINVGLTSGKVFLPEASSLPDYSQTATLDYDVFANQGLLNSLSGCVMTMVGNTTNTALDTGVPAIVDTNSLATSQASVRYTVGTNGRCTYNGIKQIYVSLHTSLTYEKQGGGSDSYIFYFYKNGTVLPGSKTLITSAGGTGAIGMVYGTLMNTADYIEIYVENPNSGDDMLVSDWQVVIRE